MIPFISNFALRFRNARAAIRQIKNGEWEPRLNTTDNYHYTAYRCGHMLWMANGPFFCDLKDPHSYEDLMAFGLICRHWVWWAAARKLKADADRKTRSKRKIPEL
ncbi:MAG: hypothetical protein ACMZI0_15015 [Symbiopectobacterium sp.]|uniref:hypothetical protein n=1 Tax=Symbiopectobacterium sp. TaxID=2952789 RepID=UPI0039E90816